MVLLQHWNLPNEITIPVGFHHASELADTNRLETRIVALANILTRSIDFHISEEDLYLQQINEYVNSDAKLPQVDHFQGNIENIFREFYGKVNDPERLFF